MHATKQQSCMFENHMITSNDINTLVLSILHTLIN